jgi:hypothetical protein
MSTAAAFMMNVSAAMKIMKNHLAMFGALLLLFSAMIDVRCMMPDIHFEFAPARARLQRGACPL